MSKEETLTRVDGDLARGHTYLAAKRLAGLTAAYPDDLQIRARRGAVNHQIGNFLEAGRWGYLTEDVAPQDIDAFEHAFKRPWDQLRALKLRKDPTAQLGPLAKERLQVLTIRAEQEGPAPLVWAEDDPQPALKTTWWEWLLGIGCGAIVIAGVLVLLGLATYGYLKLFNIV